MTDALASLLGADQMLVGLYSFFASVLMALLTALLALVPIFGDFALVLGAVFMPLCLVFYPLVPSWAGRALDTMMTGAMQACAAAFLLQLLLSANGPLVLGLNAAIQQMVVAGSFMATIAGIQGVMLMCLIGILLAIKLPDMVAAIFGGASINSVMMAASGAKKAAGLAISKGAAAIQGGSIGAGQARAAGKPGIGGAISGAIKGIGATTNSRHVRDAFRK